MSALEKILNGLAWGLFVLAIVLACLFIGYSVQMNMPKSNYEWYNGGANYAPFLKYVASKLQTTKILAIIFAIAGAICKIFGSALKKDN